MANSYTRTPPGSDSMYGDFVGSSTYSGEFGVGYSYATDKLVRGALRFTNINIPKNSTGISAALHMYAHSRTGSQTLYYKVWGVDEDNSGTGNPFGRSKTTASNAHNENQSQGSYFTLGCGNVMEEIVARNGWSSGNAMYFIVEDNGTTHDSPGNFMYDYIGGIECWLDYRVGAEPNFYPTDKSVSAPTFPGTDDFGLKISYPGYSIFTATQAQQYYNTHFRTHKINAEGVVNTTANVTYNIAHGLGYIPFCIVYAKETGSTKRYKIPRYLPIALFQDQFGSLDTTNGTVEVDATNLKITTTSNCEVYYRIFLDQVS